MRLCTVMVGLLLAPLSFAQMLDYELVRQMAHQHEQQLTPEQQADQYHFYENFNSDAMGYCMDNVAKPEFKPFSVVISLDRDGQVQYIWFKGDSNLAQCFGAAVYRARFPKPPFWPFYSVVDMRFEE